MLYRPGLGLQLTHLYYKIKYSCAAQDLCSHYRTVILYPLPLVPTDSSSFGCVLWMPQLSVGQCEELQPTAQHTSSSPNIIRLIQHVPRQANSGCPHILLFTNQKAFCPTQFQNILRHLCRHLSLHWTWGPVGHTTA